MTLTSDPTDDGYEFCESVCPDCNSKDPVICTGAKNHAGAHHAPGFSWDWEIRTEDFTVEELFGGPVNRIAPDWYSCIECGACVRYTITHTTWHNKLLP